MQTQSESLFQQKLQFGEGPEITSVPGSVFDKFKVGSMPIFSAFRLFSMDVSSEQDDSQNESEENKVRGCYRKYTQLEKEQAVNKIIHGCDVTQVSRQFGIPRRNLIRWKKNGCQRKEGGGRPTNHLLEAELYEKIKKGQINGQKEIRTAAIKINSIQNFKASKGWFSKFSRRFKMLTGEDLVKN